jgi:hypothetical protein
MNKLSVKLVTGLLILVLLFLVACSSAAVPPPATTPAAPAAKTPAQTWKLKMSYEQATTSYYQFWGHLP